MKTTAFFRILLPFILVSGLAFTSMAKNPLPTTADKLQQFLRENVSYPEQAVTSSSTGIVDVVFHVDENGKIVIDKTSADNTRLEKAVREQLTEVCCKGIKVPSYERYSIRFTFKLIG